MQSPDQRLLESDLASAEFRAGVAKGQWGLAPQEILPEAVAWPRVIFWLVAAPRTNGPTCFYVSLGMKGYRPVSPTGTFWADLSFIYGVSQGLKAWMLL